MDTLRFGATSRGGTPLANSLLAHQSCCRSYAVCAPLAAWLAGDFETGACALDGQGVSARATCAVLCGVERKARAWSCRSGL